MRVWGDKLASRYLQVCPDCHSAFETEERGMVIQCPNCSAELVYTPFYRILVLVVGLFIAWSIPEAMGIHYAVLSFTFFICVFPSLLLAVQLVAAFARPKYKKRGGAFLSLLHR